MAPPRLRAPIIRSLSIQLSRLSVVQETKVVPPSLARPLSTSHASNASITPTTVSSGVTLPPSITPFAAQTVLATIHSFPALEPLRLEQFPATHLSLPTRRDILHRAVIYEGDNTRLGTASTRWRSEIHGSARKIRPQKGSGKARLGDKKSPMLRGGGVAFGPKPRNFGTKLQKKVYDLAWRTALSYRFKKGELVIVDDALEIETPTPKTLRKIFLANHWRTVGAPGQKERGNSLLITVSERPLLKQALSELGTTGRVLHWEDVDVKDILEQARIVIERKALGNILRSHSSDLPPTGFNKLNRPSRIIDRESASGPSTLPGWSEYRKLITAPPIERKQLEPYLLEKVADKRERAAKKVPGVKGLEMLATTHALRDEAYALRADLCMVDNAHDDDEKLQEEANLWSAAACEQRSKNRDITADIVELRGGDEADVTKLRNEAEELRTEAMEWRGEEPEMEEEEEEEIPETLQR